MELNGKGLNFVRSLRSLTNRLCIRYSSCPSDNLVLMESKETIEYNRNSDKEKNLRTQLINSKTVIKTGARALTSSFFAVNVTICRIVNPLI